MEEGHDNLYESNVQVYCHISKQGDINENNALFIEDHQTIKIKDINSGRIDRFYKFSHVFPYQAKPLQMYRQLGKKIETHLWSGLSVNLITYGITNTFKTTAVFGYGSSTSCSEANIFHKENQINSFGIAGGILHGLYRKIKDLKKTKFEKSPNNPYSIGLSCCELDSSSLLQDLLCINEENHKPCIISSIDQLSTIHSPNISTANEIIQASRRYSVNWDENKSPEKNKAHAIIRIVLFNSEKEEVSSLYIIDIAGMSGINHDDNKYLHASLEKDIIGMNSVIANLAETSGRNQEKDLECHDDMESSPSILESRPFIQIILPLLAGNYQTYFLSCLDGSTPNLIDSINTIRVMSRAETIPCTCVPINLNDIDQLKMVSWDSYKKYSSSITINPFDEFFEEIEEEPISPHNLNLSSPIEMELEKFSINDYNQVKIHDGKLNENSIHEKKYNRNSEIREPVPFSTSDNLSCLEWLEDFSFRKQKVLSFNEPSTNEKSPSNRNSSSNSNLESIFRDKNLPFNTPSLANVDDVDTEKAIAIQRAEASLLRSNYEVLLNLVKEQHERYETLEKKIELHNRDKEEIRLHHEVQLKSNRLKLLDIKSKLRQAQNVTIYSSIFDNYENEIQKLEKEIQYLREENLNFCVSINLVNESKSSSIKIRKKVEELNEKFSLLKLELYNYQRQQRKSQVYHRLLEDQSKKLKCWKDQLSQQENQLVSLRLRQSELIAENDQYKKEINTFNEQRNVLINQKNQVEEELCHLKMYLSSINKTSSDKKTKNSSINSKCKTSNLLQSKHLKHLCKKYPFLHYDSSSTNLASKENDMDNKRIIQQLVHLASMNKPQSEDILPLLEKLQIKWDQQNIYLKEFSKREKEYIELLTELALEQNKQEDSYSLKEHIHTELASLRG